MIRKSGNRFSEKIMLNQDDTRAGFNLFESGSSAFPVRRQDLSNHAWPLSNKRMRRLPLLATKRTNWAGLIMSVDWG
jgi:hypothetical protein